MIKNSWIVAFIAFVILAIVVYTFVYNEEDTAYIESVLEERKDRERFLKNSRESPFTDTQKRAFRTLDYFDIDQKFKIKARLEKIEDDRLITVPTNDGKEERYLKWAYAHFELEGKPQRLLILQPMMRQFQNKLSIIFTDETSGEESYGACRYLEVTKDGELSITLDFNLAYNPYCAYSSKYSCPLPPPGNHVSAAIRAGEKDYSGPPEDAE
jgi:uncharacterized protein (DUF1684 family)